MSQMFEKFRACFGCISDCLRPFSAGDESAKNIDRVACIMPASMRSFCNMTTWIEGVDVKDACDKSYCAKGAFVKISEL